MMLGEGTATSNTLAFPTARNIFKVSKEKIKKLIEDYHVGVGTSKLEVKGLMKKDIDAPPTW